MCYIFIASCINQRAKETIMNRTRYEALQREFIMHLLKRCRRSPATKVYLYQMQTFIDSLASWLDSEDRVALSGVPFTLFDELYFVPNGHGDEDVYVSLSPQGNVIFRAWLLRRGLVFEETRCPT